MPSNDRKPRQKHHKEVESDFKTAQEAYDACDEARALPEPERSARQAQLRPMLRRHIRATWLLPNSDIEAWLAQVVEEHYIQLSIFRPGPMPKGWKPED